MKFHTRNNKSFLKSDNNEVLIPNQFEKLTEFILKKEYITEKLLTFEFKNIPKRYFRMYKKFEEYEGFVLISVSHEKHKSWLGGRIEPTVHEIKTRCLTTWLHPNLIMNYII